MQSSPISDFLSKHPLPLHFQTFAISQRMELGCWDWTQCVCLFRLFQNPRYFAQFGVTGESYLLTYPILSNSRFYYQNPLDCWKWVFLSQKGGQKNCFDFFILIFYYLCLGQIFYQYPRIKTNQKIDFDLPWTGSWYRFMIQVKYTSILAFLML